MLKYRITYCDQLSIIDIHYSKITYLSEDMDNMRNYRGYNRMDSRERQCQCMVEDKKGKAKSVHESKDSRSKVIIDESTIYEIDMDCYECLMKNKL